ncbi:unnamed protein product [Mytilus coruscus]|uniref:Uncharacterized protein n=1 Tax=Mytilus coruscus TaxID=42192 RepID=A0A6J8DRN2_MYTCO|nr:unnamed protein product [Mytilus coruscus]
MSDHQFDVEFDDMEADQDHQDEEMFSQSAWKEQDLESNIEELNMIEEEIQRKNERIIQLELMLEEKQDWFNLKSQMVKKLEGELNYVHARHPERFTFDDTGTNLVPKSLEQTLKDLEREEREETFRTKYMPVYHREMEVFRKRGQYPTNVPYFNEVSMATEFLKHKYLEAFGECFSFDYKKKSFPIKPDPSPHTHLRPCQSSFIQREGKRKFLVSGHLGEVELLPAVTEACDLERFSEIPANQALTGLDDLKIVYSIENLTMTKNSLCDQDGGCNSMTSINMAYELKFDRQVNFDENQMRKKSGDTPIQSEIITNKSVENWWQDGDSLDMWRTRSKLAHPKTPRLYDDKKQEDHANVKKLTNGKNLSNIDNNNGTNKKPPTEIFKECVLKRSVSMESVFEGDGTKMRHSFIWRMGDECVSLEKYIHVYTRNPEELYESVKKPAIEKEEEEDYEENVLYAEEIKASHIGIDKTKIKSNLRILDNIIREEEEKTKSALKQVHTENVDEVSDGTLDEKIRAGEEKIVLPPGQTGSFYEDIDGTDNVDCEEKINRSFEIIFEKPKKRMSKPKLSSEKRKTVNLMPNVTDQNIKSNENKEDVKFEEKKNISFDIMFESSKKQRSKPKLTSGKRKAQFQSKPSIDEKKDKNHEHEHKEENPTTADSKIVVEYLDGAYKEEQALKKNVSFDVFFESPKKLKPKPKLTFINRKQENETKNSIDDKEVQKEEKHEKSHIVPSKTTEVKLSNGGKLGGKFTNDVKRKDDIEIRFRFSFLHGTTPIPSRIPVMVRFNGENMSNTGINNERPRVNSARRIPVRVLKVPNTHKAKKTDPLAVRSFPESKIAVRRGTDLKINSTRNAKSPNGDESGSPRKRERGTKLPRIRRKSRIPVIIKGYVWNTGNSVRCEEKRKIDESRRSLAPLSRVPIQKNKIRRPSDCIIPRLDPNEHLPQIYQSFSKREDQAKNSEANQNHVSPTPVISEKGERTCPGLAPEFLQLPPTTNKNAMVKTIHPLSTSGLTRLTQKKGRNASLDENRIVSPSGIATLPPIFDRNVTLINRPLSASGFRKLPPINSSSKTTMDCPLSSARLSPLFIANENTANRPFSASGSPRLPPIIDENTLEMCRSTSSLSGYSLLPPIPSFKRDSVEDEDMSVKGSKPRGT